MRYLMDPGQVGAQLQDHASLLIGWVLLTALIGLVLWRTRTRVRPSWLMLYTFCVPLSVMVLTYRNHTFDYYSEGVAFREVARRAGVDAEVLAHLRDPEFQLACGRHLAPRRRLEVIREHCYQFGPLASREDDPSGWTLPPLRIRARGLTSAERVTLDRWSSLWNAEGGHLAFLLIVAKRPQAYFRVGKDEPAWVMMDDADSLDYPPTTPIVRALMAKALREDERRNIRDYCRRLLEAAAAQDARVGLPTDPLLADVLPQEGPP